MSEAGQGAVLGLVAWSRATTGRREAAIEEDRAFWTEVFRSQHPQAAKHLEELRARLLAAVRGYFRRRPQLVAGLDEGAIEALAEDVVGDTLLAIRTNLDSFRGESRFTTWAFQIAINRAARESRRRRWLDRSLDAPAGPDELPTLAQALRDGDAFDPEREVGREQVWGSLAQTIEQDLTPLQRRALLGALLEGIPLDVLAEEMETNRNALYKLLHDARQKLGRGMERRGWSREAALAQFEPDGSKNVWSRGP